jgi:class 3 adenylate cyclase
MEHGPRPSLAFDGSWHEGNRGGNLPLLIVLRDEGGETPVSTENLAVLFTDIVGSTELSQRLSAEVADEVRRDHFSILRQAIAEAGGTEVKSLGDGLMAVFGSASAALGCAVRRYRGLRGRPV